MKNTLAAVLLFAVLALGCDDPLLQDEGENLEQGTFGAVAGSASGPGFETMAGTAHFGMVQMPDGSPVFVVRLTSVPPGIDGVTTLDFALIVPEPPGKGTYSLGDPDVNTADFSEEFAACYRTSLFEDGPYRSESGLLQVDYVGANAVEGSFDLAVYTLLPTGPDTDIRRLLPVSGAFRSIRGATDIDPTDLLACDQ